MGSSTQYLLLFAKRHLRGPGFECPLGCTDGGSYRHVPYQFTWPLDLEDVGQDNALVTLAKAIMRRHGRLLLGLPSGIFRLSSSRCFAASFSYFQDYHPFREDAASKGAQGDEGTSTVPAVCSSPSAKSATSVHQP